MKPFPLKIVTSGGLIYDGNAEELVIRTLNGDMGILAGYINCIAPLGTGPATVIVDGNHRYAACTGGMVTVAKNKVTLIPTAFEWVDSIDHARERLHGILDLQKPCR